VTVLITRSLPEKSRTDDMIASCVAQFNEVYARRMDECTLPYAGIDELLSSLTEKSCRLMVLSNKPQRFTVECVKAYFPKTPFEIVFGQREDVPRKPDPAGANEIVAKSGIPSHEFLYLGDSPVDMKTAVGAKMNPVGALWGFRGCEELLANGAQWVIEKPLDLLGIIDSFV
jgi:phosphoglycolate phosphatase